VSPKLIETIPQTTSLNNQKTTSNKKQRRGRKSTLALALEIPANTYPLPNHQAVLPESRAQSLNAESPIFV